MPATGSTASPDPLPCPVLNPACTNGPVRLFFVKPAHAAANVHAAKLANLPAPSIPQTTTAGQTHPEHRPPHQNQPRA
jgi:hypothetical protein